MAGLETAGSIIKVVLQCINEISQRIELMKITNAQETGILKKLETIKTLIEEINLAKDTRSQALVCTFQELQDQMEKCADYCQPSSHQTRPPSVISAFQQVKKPSDVSKRFGPPAGSDVKDFAVDIAFAKKRASKVADLEQGLENAIRLLHFILSALHRKESETRDEELRRCIEDAAMDVSGTGFYTVDKLDTKAPAAVKNLKANLVKKYDHLELTWEYEGNTNEVMHYELSISGNSITSYKKSQYCSAILTDPQLERGKRYTFKVRAVKSFPGKWSEEVVAYFKTDAPSKPKKPNVKVVGTQNIEVTAKLPSEEDCCGDPVTVWIVEILPKDNNSTRWTQYHYRMNNSVIQSKLLLQNICDLQEYCHHDIRIKFQNSTGCSEPSDVVHILTKEPVPSVPTNFRTSSYRTAHMIKLRWNVPESNSRFVDHYEIDFSKKGKKWESAGVLHPPKLSFRVQKLSQDTRYYFRIRAVNKTGECSLFSETIDEVTRYNKAAKTVLTPLVFVGATVTSPFLLGAAAGTVAGLAVTYQLGVDDDEKDLSDVSKGKITAGVASGIGAGVGTTALATFTSPITGPLTGAGMAYAFATDGDEYSDQSDTDLDKKD